MNQGPSLTSLLRGEGALSLDAIPDATLALTSVSGCHRSDAFCSFSLAHTAGREMISNQIPLSIYWVQGVTTHPALGSPWVPALETSTCPKLEFWFWIACGQTPFIAKFTIMFLCCKIKVGSNLNKDLLELRTDNSQRKKLMWYNI